MHAYLIERLIFNCFEELVTCLFEVDPAGGSDFSAPHHARISTWAVGRRSVRCNLDMIGWEGRDTYPARQKRIRHNHTLPITRK